MTPGFPLPGSGNPGGEIRKRAILSPHNQDRRTKYSKYEALDLGVWEGQMRYRRARLQGGTYFFTVNLAERQRTLLVDHIDDLRNAVQKVLIHHPFCIDAMVVLPDHLHALWTLPEGDADFSTRWALIKAGFSRCIPPEEQRSKSRMRKEERGIWQRRFWEHLIRDERDYAAHFDYIHYNPVKHGYVRSVTDWPYSTFHRYVEQGIYGKEWGGNTGTDDDSNFGER